MKELYKDYLFNKHYLVNDREDIMEIDDDESMAVYISMSKLLGIRITRNKELLDRNLLEYADAKLGGIVPKPFYVGFPESVKKLSPETLLIDQLIHYSRTYGSGDFSEAGHSIFEEDLERAAFDEDGVYKSFEVVDKTEAIDILKNDVANLLCSTRPLNDSAYAVVKEYVTDFNFPKFYDSPAYSKNTIVKLMIDLRRTDLARFLQLPDVIKLVSELNYSVYGNKNIKKLNLKNQDRKFITTVINDIFLNGVIDRDVTTCFEKQKVWCGLLHHIHYKPINEAAKKFVFYMRETGNASAYSIFEVYMKKGNPIGAAAYLDNAKGQSALLRHLVYILSRCTNKFQVDEVLNQVHGAGASGIVLLQLLYRFAFDDNVNLKRSFAFTRFGRTVTHKETDTEHEHRKSYISPEMRTLIADKLATLIKTHYSGILKETVYIDPNMTNIALPLDEASSSSGFNVLPRGSVLDIPEGKKIRAFTYWEKVDDIDLSCFGIREDGERIEFSWRNMWNRQSDAVTFSGDETSGWNGGSEYFDIKLDEFKELYPKVRYLVFCNNVYSRIPFNKCFCKAGFMMRDLEDTGEIYEPKTVATSFQITGNTINAYLFAIDIYARKVIWLNVATQTFAQVAGETDMDFLERYYHTTEIMNVAAFYKMVARTVTDDISEATLIVSDAYEGDTKCIRSCDTAEILAHMNR